MSWVLFYFLRALVKPFFGQSGGLTEVAGDRLTLLLGLSEAEPWKDGVTGGYPASLLAAPDKKTRVVLVMCGFTFHGFIYPWSTMVQKY